MTKMQDILGRILRNRIHADIKEGTLETDRESLQQTMDMFVAANKITAEQYAEFAQLITPTAVS